MQKQKYVSRYLKEDFLFENDRKLFKIKPSILNPTDDSTTSSTISAV
jgi:hypothetical protein